MRSATHDVQAVEEHCIIFNNIYKIVGKSALLPGKLRLTSKHRDQLLLNIGVHFACATKESMDQGWYHLELLPRWTRVRVLRYNAATKGMLRSSPKEARTDGEIGNPLGNLMSLL